MRSCLLFVVCLGFQQKAASETELLCERRTPDGYGLCNEKEPGKDAWRTVTNTLLEGCEAACKNWTDCVQFSYYDPSKKCLIYSCEVFDSFHPNSNFWHYFCKIVETPTTEEATTTDITGKDVTTTERLTTQSNDGTTIKTESPPVDTTGTKEVWATSTTAGIPVQSTTAEEGFPTDIKSMVPTDRSTTERLTTGSSGGKTINTQSTPSDNNAPTEGWTTSTSPIITTEDTVTTKHSIQTDILSHSPSGTDLTTVRIVQSTETTKENTTESCSTEMDETTITIFTSRGQYSRKHVSWIEVPSLRGRESTTNDSVLDIFINSRIGCCALCTTYTGCCSVLYNSFSGACIGFSQIYENLPDSVLNTDFSYYMPVFANL